ncbi:hypothetical protein [Streptomyces wuyuanensis]|uniref:hypothetical protein n=1 Tax=Streptomyces wuyuanensis TaxID=1196353 RepID=UPI0034383139
MTNDEMPEGEEIRLLAVPINDAFAQAAAEVLRGYREMVGRGALKPEPKAESLFLTEVASINDTPDPIRTARGSLHGMLLEIAGMSFDTAIDHVRALEQDITRKPPPVWSTLVMARAVLENCLFLTICSIRRFLARLGWPGALVSGARTRVTAPTSRGSWIGRRR